MKKGFASSAPTPKINTTLRSKNIVAQVVVIYRNPRDPDTFDQNYLGHHVALTKRIPGLLRLEIGRMASPGLGSEVHMVASMFFEDVESMDRAIASPEVQDAERDAGVAGCEKEVLILTLEALHPQQQGDRT